MNKIVCIVLLFIAIPGVSQTVSVLDFVKIKDNKKQEALFFYENNWKVYREAALKKGIIKSYRLLAIEADSTAGYDLILVTEYKNADQHKASEKNFEPILKELRPNGPVLLNHLKPADFRINTGAKTLTTLYEDK